MKSYILFFFNFLSIIANSQEEGVYVRFFESNDTLTLILYEGKFIQAGNIGLSRIDDIGTYALNGDTVELESVYSKVVIGIFKLRDSICYSFEIVGSESSSNITNEFNLTIEQATEEQTTPNNANFPTFLVLSHSFADEVTVKLPKIPGVYLIVLNEEYLHRTGRGKRKKFYLMNGNLYDMNDNLFVKQGN